MMKTKRLKLSDLEQFDAKHDTSHIRELEMILDRLCSGEHAGYVSQFFRDANIYGFREAKVYLLNFVSQNYGDSRHGEETKFNEKFDEIIKLFA